ncbi:unnamed protein product [Prorocentrum cordatum]|uniref:Mei2-like C-terminal RNA recognition motif domain-containing protein n=1 Tax=Prorocentrum cordatum TaxID=2364126 RepID=A0ABN9PNX8_9DINO|nr:unnamed protein product [Polarella glacialis]
MVFERTQSPALVMADVRLIIKNTFFEFESCIDEPFAPSVCGMRRVQSCPPIRGKDMDEGTPNEDGSGGPRLRHNKTRSDARRSLSLSIRTGPAVVHEPEDDTLSCGSTEHYLCWQSSPTPLAAGWQAEWSGTGLFQRTNASQQQGRKLYALGLHCCGVRSRLPTDDGRVLPRPCLSRAESKGFAFVNFVSNELANSFIGAFSGFTKWPIRCRKLCTITWCAIQGFQANVDNWHTLAIEDYVPDQFKPVVFIGKSRAPFPQPTALKLISVC